MWKDQIFPEADDTEPLIPSDTQFLIGGLWLFLALVVVFGAAVTIGQQWEGFGQNRAEPSNDQIADVDPASPLLPPQPASGAEVDPVETGSVATALPQKLPLHASPMPAPVSPAMPPVAAIDEEYRIRVEIEFNLVRQRLDLLTQQLTDLAQRQDQAQSTDQALNQAQQDLRQLITHVGNHQHDWAALVAQHMPTPTVMVPAMEPDTGPAALVAEQPNAAQPNAEQPIAEQPNAAQPIAAQPIAEQPIAEQPIAEAEIVEQTELPVAPALEGIEKLAAELPDLPGALPAEGGAGVRLPSPIPDPVTTGSLPLTGGDPLLFSTMPIVTEAEAANSPSQFDLNRPRARPDRILATQTKFGVSIGRYGDVRGAADQWRRLREFFPALVDGKDGLAQRTETADDIASFALVFGPYGNAAEAATACIRLQNNGLQCSTSAYSGDALAR